MAHAHNPLIHTDSKDVKSDLSASSTQELAVLESAMPEHFTRPVADLMNGYLGGDIVVNWTGDAKQKPFTKDEYDQFRLFKHLPDITVAKLMHPDPDASGIANLLLRGEEIDVNEALALLAKKLEKDPAYLNYHVLATDPLKRQVKGTFIGIAAMSGDVDLQSGLLDESTWGLVERLAKLGKLSNAEVAEQLKVVTSPEAKDVNEKRIERVLKALANFEEDIVKKRAEYKGRNFVEFQQMCQPVFDDLDKALTSPPNEIITCGFVFDPAILERAAKRIEDNVKRFEDWFSLLASVIWLNGFGKLQARLSSRDAQVICAGIGNFVEYGRRPRRSFKNYDGGFNFLDLHYLLGRTLYLGFYGSCYGNYHEAAPRLISALQFLCRAKATSITRFMQCQASSQHSRALI
ncbi:MAG: hypothetical protein ACYCQI_10220 [Gammaproteobacteria bacterium]